MNVKIYHNPRCMKCRQALEIIQDKGIEPEIIDYLNEPLSLAELEILFALLELDTPLDMIRTKEPEFKEADISANSSNEEIIAAITRFPILLQRPIVVTDKGARICRPPELVEEIL
ncbi:MAG: arsenate reductase (glutaredoxin) [Alphaproteobacteria bacterium]|nr:arsenate reductase (glutaredoxin) [Alphaproteobacteria bacterium]